jgi:hypothetical protein
MVVLLGSGDRKIAVLRKIPHEWGMRSPFAAVKVGDMRLERVAAFLHYLRIGRWSVAWEILRGSRQRGGMRSG